MKKYEGMLIIKPDMTEEDLTRTVSFIEETISKNGGNVAKCEKWAKRRLAYSVKRYVEGEYYLCEFDAEPKSIRPIEGAYRLNDNILRTLITVKKVK